MDAEAAKLIGAGLAAIGTGAAGIGVGNLFGQFLQGALRNPSAADVIPRLSGILEVRSDRITRDLDETQRLKAEADAALAAYEHELAEAKKNAHSIAMESTEKAKAESAAATRKS
ncbi:ATP synthase subunit b 1 [Nymphon striatum]|nr:ATP synthase subunit b 1 [Nymphon striatum]